MLRPLILDLWVLIDLPRTPLELHKLPPFVSTQGKSQVWEQWRTRFFPTWLEPGGDPGLGLPLAQTTPAAKRSPFLSPPAPQPWAFRAPELPAAVPDLLTRGPGRGVPGGRTPRVQAGECGGRPPPSRTVREDSGRRRALACGDGWSQVGREESDLWGQGASRSIWAGRVRGNQYFR